MPAKRTASAIGKRNRQRGQEGEREVCSILADALGRPVKRALGQERDRGTDILCIDPFRIEVKRRKAIANLYDWIMQAGAISIDELDNESYSALCSNRKFIPTVALRADGKDWLVVMRLPDWIKLAREEVSK